MYSSKEVKFIDEKEALKINVVREFRVLSGKWEGVYYMYAGREVFKLHYPDEELYIWRECGYNEVQSGKWYMADDGWVMQALSVKVYKRYYRERKLVRFPMGTAVLYERRDNTVYKRKLYGAISNLYTSTFATTVLSLRSNVNKIKFAKLVVSGIDLVQAYKIAFGVNLETNTMIKKALKLLGDKIVMEEMKNNINQFLDRLNKDDEFTDEKLIEYIKEFKKSVKKGSLVHLQSIDYFLKITGRLPQVETKVKTKIEDANYIELPPTESNNDKLLT